MHAKIKQQKQNQQFLGFDLFHLKVSTGLQQVVCEWFIGMSGIRKSVAPREQPITADLRLVLQPFYTCQV